MRSVIYWRSQNSLEKLKIINFDFFVYDLNYLLSASLEWHIMALPLPHTRVPRQIAAGCLRFPLETLICITLERLLTLLINLYANNSSLDNKAHLPTPPLGLFLFSQPANFNNTKISISCCQRQRSHIHIFLNGAVISERQIMPVCLERWDIRGSPGNVALRR